MRGPILALEGALGEFSAAVGDDAGSLAPEWNGGGRHLVHDNSEGKQVGAGIQFLAPHLLGRHIGDRAQGRAGAGKVCFGSADARLSCLRGIERPIAIAGDFC